MSANVTYLLFGHDDRVLPVQLDLVRQHLAPSRIVVVQGPLGHPRDSAGSVWLTPEDAQRLNVKTIAIDDTIRGKSWVTRRFYIQGRIVIAIQKQPEEYAWVLEGDVLPMRTLDAETTLGKRTLARRKGPNLSTWLCFRAAAARHPYRHPDACRWPAYDCTCQNWPNEIFMPPDYADSDHFEWCEPGFLHLDRISHGLTGKKWKMLKMILGTMPCAVADSATQ